MIITAAGTSGNLYYWWQAAGSSTWHPQTVASASSTAFYKVPTIVWTGSGVGISAAQTGGNLCYYWFQPTGSPSWPAPTLLTSNGAPDGLAAPSAAWSGSNVILASIDYVSQADSWQSGSSWSEVPVTTGESDVYSFPSIAWAKGNAVITAIDGGGTLYYWWQSGSTWTKETLAT